jgi:hypothetical protein
MTKMLPVPLEKTLKNVYLLALMVQMSPPGLPSVPDDLKESVLAGASLPIPAWHRPRLRKERYRPAFF